MAIGISIWLALVAVSFVAAYSNAKKLTPTSRWTPGAWLKSIILGFPWAFLLTPSLAVGAIAIPAPAGLLLIGSFWQLVSPGEPKFAADVKATGALASVAIVLAWSLFSLCALFMLRVRRKG